jgi:hypothetical protein
LKFAVSLFQMNYVFVDEYFLLIQTVKLYSTINQSYDFAVYLFDTKNFKEYFWTEHCRVNFLRLNELFIKFVVLIISTKKILHTFVGIVGRLQ